MSERMSTIEDVRHTLRDVRGPWCEVRLVDDATGEVLAEGVLAMHGPKAHSWYPGIRELCSVGEHKFWDCHVECVEVKFRVTGGVFDKRADIFVSRLANW